VGLSPYRPGPSALRLDELARRTYREFGGMPELGGKSLADEVRVGMLSLKKEIDTLRLEAAAAVTEVVTEIKNGKEGVKRLKAEAAAIRAGFAGIMGNETADETTQEKTDAGTK